MTRHHLDATAATTTDVLDPGRPPVLTVAAGDTVVVRSLDAHGWTEPQRHPGQEVGRLIPDARGHTLTGPIAVEGAQPGDVLAVRLVSLVPDDWGWTVSGGADTPLNRRLGLGGGEPAHLLWRIADGVATNQLGLSVDVAPFLGVIALPPAEPGEHSTVPPRAAGGGNLDCRELVAGSALYLPVTVPGALLHLGDGHAAQGDGEVGGTAVECAMTTEVVLDLVRGAPVAGLHAETPAGRVTFGVDPDLNAAAGDALDAAVTWLAALHDVDRTTALALASTAVDLRVTQVANQTWGVHALMPSGRLRTAAGAPQEPPPVGP